MCFAFVDGVSLLFWCGQDPSELHLSKGYGFVEFAHHGHALAALRQLNNNPAYSSYARSEGVAKGETSRLIVEFSVENHAKLKLQQVRVHRGHFLRGSRTTFDVFCSDKHELSMLSTFGECALVMSGGADADVDVVKNKLWIDFEFDVPHAPTSVDKKNVSPRQFFKDRNLIGNAASRSESIVRNHEKSCRGQPFINSVLQGRVPHKTCDKCPSLSLVVFVRRFHASMSQMVCCVERMTPCHVIITTRPSV